MSQTLHQAFQSLLNLPKANQDHFIRHFARLEAPERVVVMKKHRTMIHRLKNGNVSNPIEELSYGALLMAIAEYKNERQKISRDNFEGMDLEEIGKLADFEAEIQKAKHKRPAPKTEAVMKHWGTVKRLNDKGYSLPTIAGTLEDKYGIKVSVPQLSRIVKMMKTLQNGT